jgi:hypothetical protein
MSMFSPVTLGKAKHKKRQVSSAEQNDASVSAGFSLTGAGDALLDHTAAEVGVNDTVFRPGHGVFQRRIVDLLAPCKTAKPGVFEYPQLGLPMHDA